jgi:hypothetical protein
MAYEQFTATPMWIKTELNVFDCTRSFSLFLQVTDSTYMNNDCITIELLSMTIILSFYRRAYRHYFASYC